MRHWSIEWWLVNFVGYEMYYPIDEWDLELELKLKFCHYYNSYICFELTNNQIFHTEHVNLYKTTFHLIILVIRRQSQWYYPFKMVICFIFFKILLLTFFFGQLKKLNKWDDIKSKTQRILHGSYLAYVHRSTKSNLHYSIRITTSSFYFF